MLSESNDPKDDVVCAWHPGYEVQEYSVFRGGMSETVEYGIRDSTIRISDYDVTRYFKLKRTPDWRKNCQFDDISVTKKEGVNKGALKRAWVTPEKYSPLQKPLLTPWTLPDGREVVDLNLTGKITDHKTGQPIQYAGVWLKRNPTVRVLTEENGQYTIRMESVGLRPLTEELSNSICASYAMYASKEIHLKNNYQGDVSFSLEKHPELKKSGKFMEMVEIPKAFFRMGTGYTQAGGQGRDQIGDTSMWADRPIRTVYLSSYLIGKNPVLRREYSEVMSWANENGYDFTDPLVSNMSSHYDPNEPILGINWYNAVKWCNALSEKEGRTPCYYDADGEVYRQNYFDEPRVKWKVNGYRLPTRAEWNYAATAGTHFLDFWWPEGYRKIDDYAYTWFKNRDQGFSSFAPHQIGTKKVNPFGLDGILQVGNRCWDWNGPFSGDETKDPKGCSRDDAVNFLKNILLGFHQPERETPQSEGSWGVGTLQGDSDWSALRRRYGNPMDWGHAHGVRVVISTERGDENIKFPVVFDRLRDLPVAVNVDEIEDDIEFVAVPSGSFDMGSCLPGGKCAPMVNKKFTGYDERPEHKVFLSEFEIAKYETTVGQWNKIYNWAIKNGYEFDNKGSIGHSSSDDERHPVVNVNWFDTLKWCNAASEKEGLSPCYFLDETKKVIYKKGKINNPIVDWQSDGYRLPTEAEWEYAAFGGVNDSAYYWGNFITKARKYAWFGGWTGDSGKDNPNAMRDFVVKAGPNWRTKMYKKYGQDMWKPEHIPYPDLVSHIVGQKIGNRYGLYDVFGNVIEMCWDRMAPYALTLNDRVDPKGPKTECEIAEFLKKPYELPGHSRGRALRLSRRPKEANLRTIKGCSYFTGRGKGISGRHGPFLSVRSGINPKDVSEQVGFRVARKNSSQN